MKKILTLVVGLPVLAFVLAYAQPVSPPAPYPSQMPPMNQMGRYVWLPETNSLLKFDLKFPGGTPEQLVKAIEKATDKPLNAVIPNDCTNLAIPAFAVKDVNVAQLFQALEQASKKNERFIVLDPRSPAIGGCGSGLFSYASSYGFETEGVPTKNSVWVFYWNRGNADKGITYAPWQILSSTVCKFYQLEPYLEAGYKVDDITTAVETAWKMLGVTNPPALEYHKGTKVLIAVGKEEQVNMIGDVLKQLSQGKPKDKPTRGHAEKSGK